MPLCTCSLCALYSKISNTINCLYIVAYITHTCLHLQRSGVAPFAGAETGTGGRLRDVQATGRGAHTLAGTTPSCIHTMCIFLRSKLCLPLCSRCTHQATLCSIHLTSPPGICGYCVGALHMPDHPLPWEPSNTTNPAHLASPLQILVEASNGASDYGERVTSLLSRKCSPLYCSFFNLIHLIFDCECCIKFNCFAQMDQQHTPKQRRQQVRRASSGGLRALLRPERSQVGA